MDWQVEKQREGVAGRNHEDSNQAAPDDNAVQGDAPLHSGARGGNK
ncbi:hypothetical protein ETAE_p012 (plasmid) [Edwardsiella piscicida]|uniref:Uncharacterized protein n=1 Tax=Edwardsiella piscicida TaxID=1263550 RepID=A0AAU8P7N3_EDWPI|nr:hypothetical protein ETAE_p012 [Edwardsiella tarda EIB202]